MREGALETPAPLRRQRRRRQRQRIWLPPGEAWTYVKARRADVRRDLRVLGGEIFDGAAKPTRGEEVAAEARLPRIGGGVEHSDGGGARRAGRTARGGGWALSLLVGIIWSGERREIETSTLILFAPELDSSAAKPPRIGKGGRGGFRTSMRSMTLAPELCQNLFFDDVKHEITTPGRWLASDAVLEKARPSF